MKAIVNLGGLVFDAANLNLLEKLLGKNVEQQSYDYKEGVCTYYIKPLDGGGTVNVQLIPDDVYEAQKLVYKLKLEAERNG